MGSPAVAVACVLRTGGDFKPCHVLALKEQVTRHLSLPHRFVCLSNVDIPGIECVPLEKDWPGWWSKIELFRHDFGQVMYMDLDTVVVGSLDEMASHHHEFTALQSLSRDQAPCLNSGLMAWRGKRLDLYETFRSRPEFHMQNCRRKRNWGDQGFIHHHVGEWKAWQDVFPGRVVSFKKHLLQALDPPDGTSIVCFHGKPRPWQANQSWIPKYGS